MPFADPTPPTLIRTSRLPSEYIRKNLDTINVPIRLKTDESFTRVQEGWSDEEIKNERRLVSLDVTREDLTTFNIRFSTVQPGDTSNSSLVISCIRWHEQDQTVVTSVDVLLVLEALVGEPFSVEEKSRIRRNLQFLKPHTVARASSGRLFNALMAMENPRPRNIEKDVKVFRWATFFDALNKVLSKYSANPAAIQAMPKNVAQPSPQSMDPRVAHSMAHSVSQNVPQPVPCMAHTIPQNTPQPTIYVPPHIPPDASTYSGTWPSRGLDRDLHMPVRWPYMDAPRQQRYFRSDSDLAGVSETPGNTRCTGIPGNTPSSSGDASGKFSGSGKSSSNTTDLSLKSKTQTADTDSPTRPDDSQSDSDSKDERKYSDSSAESATSATSSSSAISAKASNERLSHANMQEHDRQWAQFSGDALMGRLRAGCAGDPGPGSGRDSASGSCSGRKRRALPTVSSSLDRSFPLPNPQQIELYSQKYDSVDLDTRSASPQGTNSR